MKRMITEAMKWAGALLLVAACSDNEAGRETAPDNGDPVAVSVNARVDDAPTNTRVSPKASTRGNIGVAGTSITLCQTAAGGYVARNDHPYTYGESGWESADFVYVDKRPGTVIACYDPNGLLTFADATTTQTQNKLTVQPYAENQLWYYDNTHTTVNSLNARLNFSMPCAYARIKLDIRRGVGYVGTCQLEAAVTQSSIAFYADNPIDLATGLPTGDTSDTGYTWTLTQRLAAAGDGNTEFDLLVPSQPLPTTGFKVEVLVDAERRAITIPSGKFGGKLAAGKQYTVKLEITDAELVITNGVKVNEWPEATTITGGDFIIE